MPSDVFQHKKIFRTWCKEQCVFLAVLERTLLEKSVCKLKKCSVSISFTAQNGSVSMKIFSTMGGGGTRSSSFR